MMRRNGPGVAVASGAVLRALDKRNGPERIIRCSYGILLRDEYDDNLLGHREAQNKVEVDLDGKEYVNDTLLWLIKKRDTISQRSLFRMSVTRIMSLKIGESWVFTQKLYVSDVCTESNYQKNHPKNKGKHELVGKIRADMSFLKRENKIQPTIPSSGKGRSHYVVDFEILMEVIDRNLYYKAVYPIGEDDAVVSGSEGWTNISAAFPPGTK